MVRYLASRVLAAIPLVIAIIIVSFGLLRLVPGDPVMALVGDYPAPPEYIEQVRRDFGLDQPMHIQAWIYVSHLIQGDFGFSYANRLPVLDLLLERAGRTLALMVPGLIGASIFGIALGLLGARYPGRFVDHLVSVLALTAYSTPVFWLGQILIIVFAVNLHWLPAQGMFNLRSVGSGFWAQALDFGRHWVLPGLAITLFYGGIIARVARASLRESVDQDYIITATAKGLTMREVLWRHALPNAMIPVATVIGYQFGHALTGTIMVEAVFAWPGLGGLFLSSIASRDYPVLQGIFIFAALTTVIANLVTDIVYGYIDPRIRQASHAE